MSDFGTYIVPPPVTAVPASPAVPVPSSFVIPGQEYFAQAPLLPAGAFAAGPLYVVPEGTKRVAFGVFYTRGAVGGSAVFRLQQRLNGVMYYEVFGDAGSLVATDPELTLPTGRANLEGPVLAGADASMNFIIGFDLQPAVDGVILEVAELGVPGTPGSVEVQISGDG